MIVLRTLEKRPEDRYQSASELYNDLQGFLSQSGAHLRNNCQMADYVSKIFSDEADALISDAGRERAQAFVDGGAAAEPDRDELDFDLAQADGPGAALAKAMRSSALGVWADVDNPKTRTGSSDAGEEDDEPLFSAGKGELDRGRVSRSVGTSAGGASGHTEPSEKKAEDVESAHAMGKVNPGHGWMTQPPASSRRTIFIGLALFLAAMVGLFLWLRTG